MSSVEHTLCSTPPPPSRGEPAVLVLCLRTGSPTGRHGSAPKWQYRWLEFELSLHCSDEVPAEREGGGEGMGGRGVVEGLLSHSSLT